MAIRLNSRYETSSQRKDVIEKIMGVKNGSEAFRYYKEKFYMPNGAQEIDEESKKMLFTDYKLLNKVIRLFCSFCPDLTYKTPYNTDGENSKENRKLILIKKALETINWSELNYSIYDTLETKGDAFFYIYFDKEKSDKTKKDEFVIPKLKMLKSENMTGIAVDDANKPFAYIYKDEIYDEVVNYSTGELTATNERESVIVFEKGKVTRTIQGKQSTGLPYMDKDGKIVIGSINRESYKDIIPIIHIPSYKSQEDRFSIIPAEDYVDLCLQITQIHSDIRQVNRQLGFPRTILLDCIFTEGDGRIGGVRIAKSDEDDTRQGKIIDLQLKNGQDSNFKELDIAIDNLYDTVGMTNPTMMLRVGSSDSSKVYTQVNNTMEKKIEKYVNNIIDGFKVYFKILFLENDVYDADHDIDYSFEKPKSMIRTSLYDELLNIQLELNTGIATIRQKLRDKGLTKSEIDRHIKELNQEQMNGKNDISVSNDDVIDTEIDKVIEDPVVVDNEPKAKKSRKKKDTTIKKEDKE